MHLTGTLLILTGWLLTTALPKRSFIPRPVIAAVATLIITAGMVTLVQSHF